MRIFLAKFHFSRNRVFFSKPYFIQLSHFFHLKKTSTTHKKEKKYVASLFTFGRKAVRLQEVVGFVLVSEKGEIEAAKLPINGGDQSNFWAFFF